MSKFPVVLAPPHPATRADFKAALVDAGGPCRFEGWTFPSADLSGLDLHHSSFTRCRAAQANFSAGDLTEVAFEHCDLNNTQWHGARLSGARFVDSKLTGARFTEIKALDLTFTRCLLVNAYARGLSFRKQTLDGVNLEGADLAGCDFRDAVLFDSSLREANIAQARFEGADLRGADFGALRLADASRFKGAIISKAQAALLLGGLGLRVL